MITKILHIVNIIRENKGVSAVTSVSGETSLRGDLGFDSLDLAELTVRVERETGKDIFADGLVYTIGDILDKIE